MHILCEKNKSKHLIEAGMLLRVSFFLCVCVCCCACSQSKKIVCVRQKGDVEIREEEKKR